MPQINSVTLAGHLGNKPEVRYTQSQKKVVNFRICYTVRNKSANTEKALWYTVTCFDVAADIAEHFQKGDNVFVEGRLDQDSYADKDGTNRTAHKIVANTVGRFEKIAKQQEAAYSEPANRAIQQYGDGRDRASGNIPRREPVHSGGSRPLQNGWNEPYPEDDCPF